MTKPKNNNNKGKVPAPLDDCGGKECGACKTCYDKLRETLEQSKSSLTAVQKDYQSLQASERTLRENDRALRERIRVLTNEQDQLNLDLQSTSVKKKKNGSGRWSKRHLSGVDLPAQEVVSSIVKECVFPNMETRPIGWEDANDKQCSIYGMIMGLIEPLNGRSREEYWEEIV